MSQKELKRIGRSLGQTSIASMIDGSSNSRTFTLASGKTACFARKLIHHADIEKSTFVDPQVNGRDQSTLSEESVKDIIRTIPLQQFFPAIGRENQGRIEIMDGSRRRVACIYSGASLEVLVTSDELSLSDARQLAADLQTAKEHNLRELGLRFMLMNKNGMSKSDIAKAEGISNAKVTRAFQAASVPSEFIALFPVVAELQLKDYQLLLDVVEEAKAEVGDINGILADVEQKLDEEPVPESFSPEEHKEKILSLFRSAKRQIKSDTDKNKIVSEKLAEFSTRHTYARRKENTEKRTVSYEFSRLPKDLLKKIDDSIKSILNEK